ncbi:ABC transporter permease [Paenibacillus sp. Soil766]|uniref:fluoroquinolone export ABC transporter permease subunit n=1 Tax=Paenibacillus sp. Soil766 TaxID=1736404 RepID=UPI00070A8183|nr:ABC transporter permease [Paenibacillus sp. Soil766]KRE96452.1 ABC transporter permease [Paenibacillus sp. Soil766]
MRWMTATKYDVQFQWRHGFYGVYVLVCSLYVLLLHFVPESRKDTVTILLTFSDPSALGLILAGGIVLLEKDQGIHDSLFVTPLRLREYLFAKALSLSALSLAAAWVIHVFSLGLPISPIRFSLAVLLTSSFFTFLSIGVAVRTRSINGFILLSQLYALPFTLPLLHFFGIGKAFMYVIIPTDGSLLLLKTTYQHVSLGGTIYAVTLLVLGNACVFLWTYRSFERKVLWRIGDGRS